MSEEINVNGINNQDKGKKPIVIIAAVAVILLALVAGMGIYNSPGNRLSRQMDLGQKYLAEQDYENAVMAFKKAIEIDPKCEQAYLSLADTYVGLEDLDSAQEILEQAAELIETIQITEKMEYVAALREEQYKAETLAKAETEAEKKAEQKADAKETQGSESETSAEATAVETTVEAASTEQASAVETAVVETSTEAVNEEETTQPTEPNNLAEPDNPAEPDLPTPDLETGGTWIDELYNNLVTGNHMPVLEMLKNKEALKEASAPYLESAAVGLVHGEYNEYSLKTSSGKDVYLVVDCYDDGVYWSYQARANVCQGHDDSHWRYSNIGFGDYMVVFSDAGNPEDEYIKYGWLKGAVYDVFGDTGVLEEGYILGHFANMVE